MGVGNRAIARAETHTNALAWQTRQLKLSAQIVSDEPVKRLANPPSDVISKGNHVGSAQPKSLNRGGKWECMVPIPVVSVKSNGRLETRVVGILSRCSKLDHEPCAAVIRWKSRCHVRSRLTTQAQRRRPRDAPIATAMARRRSLQRMVRQHGHAHTLLLHGVPSNSIALCACD